MDLSEAMDTLAAAIKALPSDLNIEANVVTKIHDDVPPMFKEDTISTLTNSSYQRVIETQEGIVTKSIILWIHQ